MEHGLTVVDLFCGGGGFSEGFRQAGFEVTHAVDFDDGAISTYALNAPDESEVVRAEESDLDDLPDIEGTTVIQADLSDDEELSPDDLPDDIDVLIGSPPCKEFSSSKKGGGGDIQKGMILVDRFLYFVHELDPRHWVMENVPRLGKHLEEYRGRDDGEIPWLDDGEYVHVERSEVLHCNEYGTPQRRRRLFSGDFPDPNRPDDDPLDFDEVRRAYPRPTERFGELTSVEDPIDAYDIELGQHELSDHFYDSHLTHRESKEIEVRKADHSFYGPMSFPDDPEVPSRTVVAMNRRIARETLVMEEESPPSKSPELSRFRKPTLRELATIQGFPITYQFTGTSLSQKRRRVGDAVPPTMAYRIALGILREEGHDISEMVPDIADEPPQIEYDLSDPGTTTRKRRKLSLSRSFRHHVPYDDMREFRVDLETNDNTPRHPLSEVAGKELEHPVGFQVMLYRGYAKEVESEKVPFDRALEYLREFEVKYDETERVRRFLDSVVTELGDEVPDATTLQAIRSRRADTDDPREYEILETIAANDDDALGIVDRHFPEGEYGDVHINVDIIDGTRLPARVLMKLVAAHFVAHKLNNCGRWISRNPQEVYLPDGVELSSEDIPGDVACTAVRPAHGCIEDRFRRIAERGWGSESAHERLEYAD